jgi:predicted dehydrogenase
MVARPGVTAVGSGRWGSNIVRTLHALGALEAIVEPDPAKAGQIRASYPDVPLIESLDAALGRTSGAFALATPAATHAELAMQVLTAGRDAFVEKPLALRAVDARAIAACARRNGRIVMTGHLLLYRPGIDYVLRAVAAGDIGRVYSISQVRRNLGTVRRVENVLLSLGVHDLAVQTELCAGEPEIIAGAQSVLNPPVEDQMSIRLRYPGGVDAQLDLSWLWPYKERRLLVLGERGALGFDELTGEVTHYAAYARPDGTIADGPASVVFCDTGDALRFELEHFIDCVANRREPRSGSEHSVRVVELLERIGEAVRPPRDSASLMSHAR